MNEETNKVKNALTQAIQEPDGYGLVPNYLLEQASQNVLWEFAETHKTEAMGRGNSPNVKMLVSIAFKTGIKFAK